jgi:hypothetical protein
MNVSKFIKRQEDDGIISSFFFFAFTIGLIWFGRQFCHQVVPAPSRLQLRGIEP